MSELRGSLEGRTVALLEARRSAEVARMVERQGGRCLIAPVLREVPSTDLPAIGAWLDRLAASQLDVVVFLTGVGCRALLEGASARGSLDRIKIGLGRARVVARGPKPVLVLKEYGIRIDFVPPEPNTSDELLAELSGWDLSGKTVGLQIYGGVTPFLERLRLGLAAMGAIVDEVAPYRWEGPSDDAPARSLLDACLARHVDVLAIFSSSQIDNLFSVAEAYGKDAELREALNDAQVLVASVGPVSTQAIESHGVKVDLQPEHPKMGPLIMALGPALADRQAALKAGGS